jgi:aspartate-semialdehyde dehydrogenase
MVGSVLVQRMREEHDFDLLDPVFFSTSQAGAAAPAIGKRVPPLKNARDLSELAAMEVLISCQGGEYTSEIYPKLRQAGWQGYWIDAASTLRMADDAVIILDPVNRDVIDRALESGVRNYIGGNCTVSLMLMAMTGLFRAGLVEWVSVMTYQAASGAGAQNMRELVSQMGRAHASVRTLLDDPASAILDIDRTVSATLRSADFPTRSSAIRWRAACCRGSPKTSATVRARKSGRRRPKATRFSAARRTRFRWTAFASVSARCGATARR